MDITNIDDLYLQSTLSVVEMVESGDLPNIYRKKDAINDYLISKLKNKYCNKCNHMGYINNDISIINRSIGKLKSTHFNGNIYYNIQIRVNICVPLIGSIISCKIIGKNDAGVLCENGPLKIILCSDIDNIESLVLGENILIEILNYKVVINDKNIRVLGRLKNSVLNI